MSPLDQTSRSTPRSQQRTTPGRQFRMPMPRIRSRQRKALLQAQKPQTQSTRKERSLEDQKVKMMTEGRGKGAVRGDSMRRSQRRQRRAGRILSGRRPSLDTKTLPLLHPLLGTHSRHQQNVERRVKREHEMMEKPNRPSPLKTGKRIGRLHILRCSLRRSRILSGKTRVEELPAPALLMRRWPSGTSL